MAVSFQIDGTDMPYDPWDVSWRPAEVTARKHSGAFLVSAKRLCSLSLPDMTTTDFATLEAKCDGQIHSIKIPHPNTRTYTTFSTAVLRLARPPKFQDLNVYDIEIDVSFVTLP